jgi:XTP/dITP diphosphohydrolase
MPERERCYVFYGELKGIIGVEKHGQNGFGFDPVFYVPELNKYLAEIPMEEKNRLSHRGKAIQAFINFIQ